MSKRGLAAIGFLIGFAASAFAQSNSQPTACLPTTGVFTAVQEQAFINAALAGVINNNRGPNAPSTDCSGVPVEGQFWLDTSISPHSFSMYDGTQWLPFGALDDLNHIWLPVIGGGAASINAASVTDLCNGVPQDYVTISSGASTITSFGASCGLGQIKKLSFNASLVIAQSNANILTQSGQSITTMPGDQAEVIYLGGGLWRVTAYWTQGGTMPVGSIIMTAGASADPGYLLCYGEAVSRTTFAALFARIGTSYGTGDGATTFNVPDLRGRMPAGQDNMGGVAAGRITLFNATTLGNSGGAQSNVVEQSNLANFALPASASSSATTTGTVTTNQGPVVFEAAGGSGCCVFNTAGTTYSISATTSVSTSVSVSSGGGSTPFPTVPPTQVVAYEIKY